MGSRGPVPKRSESRQRRNEPAIEVKRGASGMSEDYKPPQKNSHWSNLAKKLWDELRKSGQTRFYEPSDWAVAYLLCETVTEFQRSKMKNGQMLASIQSLMSDLLMTEGARRRVGIELDRKSADEVERDENVVVMAKWREKALSVM